MASIPMAGYSSPQIRRAMLGQRKPAEQTSKPLDIKSTAPKVESPLASPAPTQPPATKAIPALPQPEEKKISNSLVSAAAKTPAVTASSSLGAVPETKQLAAGGSLVDTLKPYFTPPISRKQIFAKFRTLSQDQPNALHFDDDAINLAFPRSDVALGSGMMAEKRANRFTIE